MATFTNKTMSDEEKPKQLLNICRKLYWGNESLGQVERWMEENKDNLNLLKEAANYQDEDNLTPLHHLVMARPPSHLVSSVLNIAPDAVKAQNIQGYLPIHTALEKKASSEVIKILLLAYPEAAEAENSNGYLPLHSACKCKYSPDVIRMLLEAYPDSIKVPDKSGSLPLHVACYYNASTDVVRMLLDKYPEATKMQNKFSKFPLHYAHEKNAPHEVISMLFEEYPKAVTKTPFSSVQILFSDQFYKVIPHRLEIYLEQEPEANYNFYCLLQSLPGDERKKATLHSYVQKKVNERLRGRVPTLLFMLDLFLIFSVILSFGMAVTRYNNFLFTGAHPNLNLPLSCVIIGGIYFLTREFMQIYSFFKMGYFMTWLRNPTHWIEMISICIMFIWPILMLIKNVNSDSNEAAKEIFRSSATLAAGFLFLMLFSFLRRISKEFAIFVRGLLVIAKRLLTFLAVLAVIITAFALMFYSMFIGASDPGPFGDFGSSWFQVYNMILGNYDPDEIFMTSQKESSIVYLLYIILGIGVIIILLNILIAIVVDTYGSVKEEDAEEVFWKSRLEFVTEVVVILKCCKTANTDSEQTANDFGQLLWASMAKVFKDKRNELYDRKKGREFSSSCPQWITLRLFVFILLLMWVMLGAATFGLLWPSQVREWLWSSTKDEDSQKKSIQELKRIMTFKEKESTLESFIKSTVVEIKKEIEKVDEKSNICILSIKDIIENQKAEASFIQYNVAEIKKEIVKMDEKHHTYIENIKQILGVEMVQIKSDINNIIENHKADVTLENNEAINAIVCKIDKIHEKIDNMIIVIKPLLDEKQT